MHAEVALSVGNSGPPCNTELYVCSNPHIKIQFNSSRRVATVHQSSRQTQRKTQSIANDGWLKYEHMSYGRQ